MKLERSEELSSRGSTPKAPLEVHFVTLFPEMILPAVRHSILRRAEEKGYVSYHATNPRDYTTDNHKTVDDSPFGGGPGMVMKCEPIKLALSSISVANPGRTAVVITDPTGQRFTQDSAAELAQLGQVIFLCGHYEGIDDRIRQKYATHAFSIGDFILTGGEPAALVMTDAIVRLLPGVLGSAESLDIDAHNGGLLSAPQFTRPVEWEGLAVPSELRNGNHQDAERWKRREALRLTRTHRPDLFRRADLAKSDLDLL